MTDTELTQHSAKPTRRSTTFLIALATAFSWLFATSAHIAMALFEWGAMPEWMRPLTHIRGPIRSWLPVAGLVGMVLLVLLATRLPRRTVLIPTAVVAGLVGIAFSAEGPHTSVQNWFSLMRPDLERAAILPAVTDDPDSDYYYDLPSDLAYIATDGWVTTNGRGELFVPQWAGFIDDAGGFIRSPGGNPTGWEMLGMQCENPVSLDGYWWACGVRPRY